MYCINFICKHYVKLLEEILSSGCPNAIRFFKKAELHSLKRKRQKGALETLQIIESKNGIHAMTAKRLCSNFNYFINSFRVQQQYWSSLKVKAEKIATNTAQIILL